MSTKDKPSGRSHLTFTEAARRAQLIECAIETIATLGYAQTSLAHIAKRAGIHQALSQLPHVDQARATVPHRDGSMTHS